MDLAGAAAHGAFWMLLGIGALLVCVLGGAAVCASILWLAGVESAVILGAAGAAGGVMGLGAFCGLLDEFS